MRLAAAVLGETEPAGRGRRRTKIWDLSHHIHCSIVGTCLSTAELRHVLGKAGLAVDGASEHELHSTGVQLAGQHDGTGKLLHKALDKRHRLTIARYDKARTADEVRALWQLDSRNGDIPGAYWAAVTHPAATDALVREIFGEVHMLSHLVGAANRADIRRLKELETENALLRAKLARQQERLHEAITTRDARIHDLGALLAERIADRVPDKSDSADAKEAALGDLVGRLERRLRSETNRRAALEDRLATAQEELGLGQAKRAALERQERALRGELDAIEADLGGSLASEENAVPSGLAGLSVLYVGGRPDRLGHLRTFAERSGARFLHHDGGIEDRGGLLAGSVGRADIVMFPVDCVSHDAVATVKRLCRQTAKPYVPLRSTGMSSFIAALLSCKERSHDGH